MESYKLGEMERRLAEMLWERAPLRTRELVEACAEAFAWKRTTTYTMLRRLCDRGLFVMEKGEVRVQIPKEEFEGAQGEQFVNENFEGSLPRFLAAFVRRKKLTEREIDEIERLIRDHEEG
ncbi:MAG: BlaI/MecI/CopY family transcriptional regulator [Candidatus Spyradocola sp.]